MLNRKAQVTVYVIIGIILLASVVTYLYIRTDVFKIEEPEVERVVKVAIEPASIREYVRSCIDQVTRPLLFEIASKGGTFNTGQYGNVSYDAYESYNDNPESYMSEGAAIYTYACHWEIGHGCVSNLITRQTIEKELNIKIRDHMFDCLDLDVFEGQGYEYEAGDIEVDTKVGVDDVNVILKYPMKFWQGDNTLTFLDFSSTVDVPLGRVFDLSVKVMNDENVNYHFEPYEWMLKHGVNVKIYKHQPYPDIIYQLAKKIDRTGEILRYNFALQGHDTAAEIGEERAQLTLTGWCFFTEDQNCYANAEREDCNEKAGVFSTEEPLDCRGATTFIERSCEDGECNDCANAKHGESFCQYDSVISPGFDYVGSRHFLQTCVDGEIFYEECRDYREEVCVSWNEEDQGETLRKSTCRPNNWQKCIKQRDPLSCSMAGDCYWSGWLEKPSGFGQFIMVDGGSKVPTGLLFADDITRPYSIRKCIPKNPPGFKHWKGDGAQVCAMANMLYDGDYDSDKQVYADHSNVYCYFLGDCGNYWNFADQYTAQGFFNSDTLKPENKIRSPFELYPGIPNMADIGMFAIHQTLDQFSREPITLTGNELVDPVFSFRSTLGQYAMFWQFAAGQYTKSNFEDHIMDHITSLNLPITTHYGIRHISLCNTWGAPKNPLDLGTYSLLPQGSLIGGGLPSFEGFQRCEVCNTDLENNHKPCSEYRCKSLGKGCIFYYEDGRGTCTSASITDRSPPEIVEMELMNEDYTIEDATLLSTPPPRNFEGARICHGDCSDDDGVIDGIEPYTNIKLRVRWSEETQCKLSYFPSFDYGGIPLLFVTMFMAPIPIIDNKDLSALFGSEFKEEMDIVIPIYPTSEITKSLFDENVQNTMLELAFFPADIEAMMVGIANGFSQVAQEFGDASDAATMQKWIADYYIAKPLITDSFKTAQSAMKLILEEAAKGNKILFFDCNDRNGNANQNFFIKFALGKDKTPAKLVDSRPANGTVLDANAFDLTLRLNEPADCKFRVNQDDSYDAMPLYFDCQVAQTESLDGTFHCTSSVLVGEGENNIYVKCKDQPLAVREYSITFIESNKSGLEDQDAAMDERLAYLVEVLNNTVYINDEVILKNEPRIKVTGNANLIVKFASDSVCRYTTNPEENILDIPSSNEFTNCINGTCMATMPVSGAVQYTIKCVDTEIFSTARNVNPESFVLTYTR